MSCYHLILYSRQQENDEINLIDLKLIANLFLFFFSRLQVSTKKLRTRQCLHMITPTRRAASAAAVHISQIDDTSLSLAREIRDEKSLRVFALFFHSISPSAAAQL